METKKSISILRKPNSALVMVVKRGKLTALGRKLYNVMLMLTQQSLPELKSGDQVLGIDAAHVFRAPLHGVVGPAVAGKSDPKTVAKTYLLEMLDTSVDWEAPDDGTGVIWSGMNMVSQVELRLEKGLVWLEWALPPKLLLELAKADRYTTLDLLTNVAPLKKYASVALYEICARYKNNPSGVTSANPCEWWVAAMMSAPPPVDEETGRPKIREWRKFKDEVVKGAIEEINESSDITIALLESKTGKRVTSVQFSVQKKRVPSHEAVLTQDVALLASRLDVPLSSLAKLVQSNKYTNIAILTALTKLEARAANSDLDPVDQPLAYLRSVLEDQARYVAGSEAPQPAQQPRVEAALPVATIQKDWLTVRVEELRGELFALPDAEQQEYVAAVQREQKAKGASPAIMKRLATGEWKTQALALNLVVGEYAKQIYGPEWRKEPPAAETTQVIDV